MPNYQVPTQVESDTVLSAVIYNQFRDNWNALVSPDPLVDDTEHEVKGDNSVCHGPDLELGDGGPRFRHQSVASDAFVAAADNGATRQTGFLGAAYHASMFSGQAYNPLDIEDVSSNNLLSLLTDGDLEFSHSGKSSMSRVTLQETYLRNHSYLTDYTGTITYNSDAGSGNPSILAPLWQFQLQNGKFEGVMAYIAGHSGSSRVVHFGMFDTGGPASGVSVGPQIPIPGTNDPTVTANIFLSQNGAIYASNLRLKDGNSRIFINGTQVVGLQESNVPFLTATGTDQDPTARQAINDIIQRLQSHGLFA